MEGVGHSFGFSIEGSRNRIAAKGLELSYQKIDKWSILFPVMRAT